MNLTHHTSTPSVQRRSRLTLRDYVAIVGTLVLAGALTMGTGFASQPASAAVPPSVELCNGVLNADAQTVECHVTVANTLDIATGVGSSVVSEMICVGAPGASACGSAVITNYPAVITSIEQCNGSGNAGGSVVKCDVIITNTVTGSTTEIPGTINQCIGSGEGGGATPLNCGPLQNSSGATITQCNGSGNGGGGDLRVTCSYGSVTETPAFRVTVNQCNGSANGGGATVTCSASMTNSILPAGATPPITPPVVTPPVTPYISSPDSLAATGFNGWPLALYGTIAVLLGAMLVMRSGRVTETVRDD